MDVLAEKCYSHYILADKALLKLSQTLT